jgi:hypothetical protein
MEGGRPSPPRSRALLIDSLPGKARPLVALAGAMLAST